MSASSFTWKFAWGGALPLGLFLLSAGEAAAQARPLLRGTPGLSANVIPPRQLRPFTLANGRLNPLAIGTNIIPSRQNLGPFNPNNAFSSNLLTNGPFSPVVNPFSVRSPFVPGFGTFNPLTNSIAGFNPYSAAFNPYSAAFNPYSAGFGFNPYANAYGNYFNPYSGFYPTTTPFPTVTTPAVFSGNGLFSPSPGFNPYAP